MTEEERLKATEIFVTGHYPCLLQALAMAAPRCMVWQVKTTGLPVTLIEMFDLAKKHDAEHPLGEGAFYMVTNEGAIGLSPGLEYLTEWIFIPMPAGEERDRLLAHVEAELQRQKAEDEAGVTAQPTQPTSMPQCPNCGTPLVPGNAFCTKCGTKII